MTLHVTIFRMRRFIFAVLFVSIFPIGTAADGGQVDRNYVNQLSARKAEIDREYFTRSEAEHSLDEVIAFLRGLDEDHSGTHSQLLIRLKDDPTIEKYISRFLDSNGIDRAARGMLAGSWSPWVIPRLADALEKEEVAMQRHPNPEIGAYYGVSAQTAIIIRALVSNSREFPDVTRNWANGFSIHGQAALSELRDMLIVWWQENERHFENEDYHLVRPVSWDLVDADENQDEATSRETEPEEDEPTREAALVREAQEIADERREVIAEQQDSSIEERTAPAWLWLAGMIALLGGAFVARRFCSKRRRE